MKSLTKFVGFIWLVTICAATPLSYPPSYPDFCGAVVDIRGFIHTEKIDFSSINNGRISKSDETSRLSYTTIDITKLFSRLEWYSQLSDLEPFLLILQDERVFRKVLTSLSNMVNMPLETVLSPTYFMFDSMLPIFAIQSDLFLASVGSKDVNSIYYLLEEHASENFRDECQTLTNSRELASSLSETIRLMFPRLKQAYWSSPHDDDDMLLSEFLQNLLFKDSHRSANFHEYFTDPYPQGYKPIISRGYILYIKSPESPNAQKEKLDSPESLPFTYDSLGAEENDTRTTSISIGTFQQVYWVSVALLIILILTVWPLFNIDPSQDNVVYRMSERQVAVATSS